MKRIFVIATAAAALGAALLGHLYLDRLEAEVSGGPRLGVLVAVADVPVGAVLSEKQLAVRDIPRAYIETRHIRAGDASKVLGTRVAGGLKAGEALLWSDLEKFQNQARVLSGLVQQGSRAIAIDNRSADFQGLLRPGDRVDVLLTTGGKEDGGATITLLQNLLVLSVGGSMVRPDDDGGSSQKVMSRGGSVTLSATVEQAQLLTQAQQRGRLTLTLRNAGDITLVEGLPETTGKDLVPAKDAVGKPVAGARREVIEHVR
ncbi:MAG TPA: Flp pilus assembly protein CpaB [Polyangiaceae bacterium]|nr:Flp pilus assembly protein CpaB [Polyangiaceae bacterium]